MKKLLFALTVTALMSLVTACSDNIAVGPQSTAGEHLLYIAPAEGNMIRVFAIEQGTFIDSLVIDSAAVDDTLRLHVIGDDSLLTVSTRTKTFIVDLRTKNVIGSFEATHPVFSRDSRFYYTAGSVRTFPGQQELFNQPGGIAQARFCNQSEVVSFVYFSTIDTAKLVLYNVLANSVGYSIKKIGTFVLGLQMMFCTPYPVNRLDKVFLNIGSQYGATDFFTDTVRILDAAWMGDGATHVISPDEKYAFFTDVGAKFWGYVPTGYLYVFDAASEDSVAAVHYQGIDQSDLLLVSYDSKYPDRPHAL